jgi:hypothetical protein
MWLVFSACSTPQTTPSEAVMTETRGFEEMRLHEDPISDDVGVDEGDTAVASDTVLTSSEAELPTSSVDRAELALVPPEVVKKKNGYSFLMLGQWYFADRLDIFYGARTNLPADYFRVPIRKRRLRNGNQIKERFQDVSDPRFEDWLQRISKTIDVRKPDFIVVMMAGHEPNLRESGATIAWNSEKWQQTYQSRLRRLMGALRPTENRVFWLGLPDTLQASGQECGWSQSLVGQRQVASETEFPVTYVEPGDVAPIEGMGCSYSLLHGGGKQVTDGLLRTISSMIGCENDVMYEGASLNSRRGQCQFD